MAEDARESLAEPRRPVTVFVLDDHAVVRHGIRSLLERDGDIVVVGESGFAQEAARLIPAIRPHVAILDVRLPDGSGVEVCRQVHTVDPGIAALMLTSYDEDEALFAAIMAGAAGYLLKRVRPSDLADTVRRVADGESMLDPALTTRVLARLRHPTPQNPLTRHLTPKEWQVLQLLGEGLPNREIAQRLGLSEKTTKNYVSAVLGKLGVKSRTQAAIIATNPSAEHGGTWPGS
ncbi:response regulator transcription factor [Nocardioides sp. zg-536]|uniref:Response regulator transcription factor n=1 Tax=Nocardioides faecalis TaxID=2803858 RepID=A0A938Y7K7_9ACTN|nr:response regulator transcription factor [Nocardioides faecalis]MBM9461568.1 response regulator transcription factor [Nocardioides faecalis]QVI57798.1 response regulator transcription factor [Nocardioides faecalis]